MSPRVLVVDHRDSFVFNLVEDLRRAGAEVVTVRSDLAPAQLEARLDALDPALVVLSPGPGAPEDAGVMVPFLRARRDVPVLGVCLGMQAMAVALGGRVGRAPAPVHGMATAVEHADDPLFEGVPSPFPAGRYHSLAVLEPGPELAVVARTRREDGAPGLAMAVRHARLPWVGLQFHPESVLSPEGPVVLRNALRAALAHRAGRDLS